MGKLKMGNGLSKGEQDKAWTDFFNKANEIGVKYRDEEHLQGRLIDEFHEIHHRSFQEYMYNLFRLNDSKSLDF